jgi:hypothetical protein
LPDFRPIFLTLIMRELSDAARQPLLRASFSRFNGVSMQAITIPTTLESTPTTFTPAFAFVAQSNDFDDVFACAAMLSGKTIEEVREIAIATDALFSS